MTNREKDPEDIINEAINQSDEDMNDLTHGTEVEEDLADLNFEENQDYPMPDGGSNDDDYI